MGMPPTGVSALQETPAARETGSSGPRSAAMMMAVKGMLAGVMDIFRIQAGDNGWSCFSRRFICVRLQICHLPDSGRGRRDEGMIQNLAEISTPRCYD